VRPVPTLHFSYEIKMNKLVISGLLVLSPFVFYGQDKALQLEGVQIFEFKKRGYPDSLEVCGGEWFVEGKANNLNELGNQELQRIKKKVAEHGCSIAFVDVRKVYTPVKGQLYILGLKRKK